MRPRYLVVSEGANEGWFFVALCISADDACVVAAKWRHSRVLDLLADWWPGEDPHPFWDWAGIRYAVGPR